jgi:outer membrane protein
MFYLPVSEEEKNAVESKKAATPTVAKSPDNDTMLDLDELINIALINNRMIEVVRQKQVQSQGQLTQARSGYLPHLELEGRYYYTERKDSAQSNGYENTGVDAPNLDEVEEDDVVHGAVNFSQLIYDFGKTTGAIGVGQSNLKAADAQLQRQVQDIVFQVKVAYYNVLEKRRLIDVATESVKSFKQHLDRAKLYLKAGVRTKIDVINAEVELSNANMSLLRAQYNLKTARVILVQVLGIKPNQGRYALSSDHVQLDTILDSMPPVPDTLDNLINEAMEQRPDILQLNRLTEAAKANLKRVKGDYWPSITAEAKYNDYDTDLSLYKDSWEVGAVATWDLFSGLHTKGAVVEAQGRLLENNALLQDLQLAVVREVTESYLRSDENRESVQIALQTLELARENVLLAEKRYQSGANDVIEFNDAQLSLTRTRNELVVTYYAYLTAIAGIDFAVGNQPQIVLKR